MRKTAKTLGEAIEEMTAKQAEEAPVAVNDIPEVLDEPDDKAVLLSDVIQSKAAKSDESLAVENIIDFDVPPIVGFDPEWKKRHEDDLSRFDYCFVRKDNEFSWKKQIGGGGWETVEDHPDMLSDVKLCRRPKAVAEAHARRSEHVNQMREAAISTGFGDALQEVSKAYRIPVENLIRMGSGDNTPSRRAGQHSGTKFYSIGGM